MFLSEKRIVAKFEMSGNEAKAVQILEEEKIRARKEGKPHEAYEIEMLLVEMLIYKVVYLLISYFPTSLI